MNIECGEWHKNVTFRNVLRTYFDVLYRDELGSGWGKEVTEWD